MVAEVKGVCARSGTVAEVRSGLASVRGGCGLLVLGAVAVVLTGCSMSSTGSFAPEAGTRIRGSVFGGQQPVVGSHVYLMAASTSGYGSAATSLISSGAAGTDSIGSYMLTDSGGNFTITGDYTCTQGQQVYVYALGGDPGAGTNAAAGFLAAVGSCPAAGTFSSSLFIGVNELSTVAFAYAVSGFAVDPLHVATSATTRGGTGLANAFAGTANLMNGATTPAGNGTVPAAELNTLSNILAACLNTAGAVTGPTNPTACYTLFHDAPNGASIPTDTAAAAINIAHHPTANVAGLFGLQTASPPFQPGLSSAPADFTVAIRFTGGGLATSSAESGGSLTAVNNIAIDSAGNVWKPNYGTNTMTELSPLGVALSGSGGFTGGGLNGPANVAIDLNDNAWTANVGSGTVSKLTAGGVAASGSPFGAGAISSPQDLAIDGSGNVWVANASTVAKLTNAGANVSGSPFSTNTLNTPVGIAILPSGNVWVTNATGGGDYIAVYTSAGAKASSSPYTSGGLYEPYAVAFDASGNGWTADETALSKLSSTGVAASGSPFTSPSSTIPTGLAIDGSGNVWATDVSSGQQGILEANSSGTYLSGAVGFQSGESTSPEAIAVDGSGNVWYSSYNDATVHELVGAGSPVVTPLSYGVAHSELGARP